MLLTFLSPGLLHSTVPWLIIRNLFEIMDRHRTIIFMFCVWIQVHLRNVQDVRIQCHADELVCTIWWAMSHTFEHSGYPQVSTSLHAPCSAMRSTDDTRARCNQKTTCIMSCAWDHAHDVMRREPERSFTDEFLASWFCLVAKHGFKSVCIMSCVWDHAHERMRTQDCTTFKWILLHNPLFFHFVCSIMLFFVL